MFLDRTKETCIVNDPDLLPDDKTTCEVWVMFFCSEKDKYYRWTKDLQMVNMRRDGRIVGYPIPMGYVTYGDNPATLEEAFSNKDTGCKVIKVEATDRFIANRKRDTKKPGRGQWFSNEPDLRKKPVYTMHRVYKVVIKHNHK
jgi:hypothetical protein